MTWDLYDAVVKPRILIAVSKFGHCLNDLLYRWEDEDFCEKVEWSGLSFHYFPVTSDKKFEQENKIINVINEHSVDLLALIAPKTVIFKSL